MSSSTVLTVLALSTSARTAATPAWLTAACLGAAVQGAVTGARRDLQVAW